MAEGSRMLVIGLDGATWDLIKPWADEGKLPTFKKLMENGVWGELESTVPPWTVPAWNCLSAGKRPENLGLTTFLQRETGSYKFRPYFVTKNPETCFWASARTRATLSACSGSSSSALWSASSYASAARSYRSSR